MLIFTQIPKSILVSGEFDPTGIFRKQDYSSKKIDTRGPNTRHTLDKRTMLRASHISKPSTISPTMKRNLFFHVQLPVVHIGCLFTKCFTRGKHGTESNRWIQTRHVTWIRVCIFFLLLFFLFFSFCFTCRSFLINL